MEVIASSIFILVGLTAALSLLFILADIPDFFDLIISKKEKQKEEKQ